jgi:hypothetical protein
MEPAGHAENPRQALNWRWVDVLQRRCPVPSREQW